MLSSKKTLLLSTFAFTSCPIWANPLPDAGVLLKQQQIAQPFTPQTEVNIEIPEQQQGILFDNQQQIHVNQIVIQGNESISKAKLNVLIEDKIGKTLTLADLQKLTQDITTYYQSEGYAYSRAYLPAQTLADGVVEIAILEAKYDRIQIKNNSNTSDKLIENILSPLQSGQVIEAPLLQQQLMILGSLNGINTRNVMSAGRYLGTSDLTIYVEDAKKVAAYVGMDNFGNEYTREWRLNAGASAFNILGLGDELAVNMMSSIDLNFARLSYEAMLNGSGTRLGASYSYLDYDLIKEYKDLDAVGTAQQASVWVSQPVLLNNQTEVVLAAQYDFKRLEDDIRVADLYRHRDIHVGKIRLDVAQRDDFAGGGLTKFSVSSDFGYVNYKNNAAKSSDLATANTQGGFRTAALNVSRLQNLGGSSTQLYTELRAQYSPDNLDTAQQFTVGGVSGIAGYQNSVLSGSAGYYALAELKQNLHHSNNHLISAKIYIDTAKIKRQATTWKGLSGNNQEQIHSAGLGLNWSHVSKLSTSLLIGFPVGSKPSSLNQRDHAEAWFSVSKQF